MIGEVLANSVESVLYIIFLNHFCETRKVGLWKWIGTITASAFLFLNICIADKIEFYHCSTTIIDCFIIFLYAVFFLKGSWLMCFCGIILFNLGLAGSVVLLMNLSVFFSPDGINTWMNAGSTGRNILLVFNKVVLVCYVYGVVKLKQQFWKWIRSLTEISMILLSVFVMIMFCLILQQLLHTYDMDGNAEIYVLLLGGVLILVVVIFFQFIRDLKKEKIMRENQWLLELTEIQKNSYERELKQYDKIRKIEHDMKNQLIGLQYFLERYEIEKAQEYLKEILTEMSGEKTAKKSIFSNQTETLKSAWEAIIELKTSEAIAKGIAVEKKIIASPASNINPIDLCAVLGNLLDNAIEAEEKNKIRRELSIEIQEYSSFFCVYIRNWLDDDLKANAAELISQKDDKLLHGIGLCSTREIIKKYDGKMEIKISGNYFCTKAIFLTRKM